MIGRICFQLPYRFLEPIKLNRVLAVIWVHLKYSLLRVPLSRWIFFEKRNLPIQGLSHFSHRDLFTDCLSFFTFFHFSSMRQKDFLSMSILAFHWYVSHCFVAFHHTMQFGRLTGLTMDMVRWILSISTSIHLQFLSFYSNTNLKGDSLPNRWILILWILTVNQKFWCLVFYCWFTRIYRNNQGPSLRRRIPHSIVWRRDD